MLKEEREKAKVKKQLLDTIVGKHLSNKEREKVVDNILKHWISKETFNEYMESGDWTEVVIDE